MTETKDTLSFWEHLDILRTVIVKTIAVWCIFSVFAFLFKEQLFNFVLAPKESDFLTYRIIENFCNRFGFDIPESFHVQLINTGLAQQFIIHMKTALCAGILCASPYILYQLFRFVSPALYADERKYAVKVVGGGYMMFIIGVLASYYLIFPLTFRFLGTYQVAGDVTNMISLQSYMEILIMMCLAMGIVFEMPVLCWLFGKLGFISEGFMRKYRKHAVVIILFIAAIITPTSDIFTLTLVSLPMWILYEISIFLVRPKEIPRQIDAAPTQSVQ